MTFLTRSFLRVIAGLLLFAVAILPASGQTGPA